MELPNLGQQCDAAECKQLDFLPLNCKCGRIFCTEHFKTHVVECLSSETVSKDELQRTENVFVCSHHGCGERSIIELLCDRCKKHYCIEHRHFSECSPKSSEVSAAEKEKYAAPVRQFNEAKASVDKQVEENLQRAKKKAKSRDTAAKVQLMKIKTKATGLKSIPTTNRVYFNISISQNDIKKSTPVFVSEQWSLGRAIDAIAEECKLLNNNNKGADKKLRLFRSEDNRIVSKNMSENMHHLLSHQIILNGDSLIIEYVDDTCESL